MPPVESCPFQPPPQVGLRYTSVFELASTRTEVPVKVWDLSNTLASIAGLPLPVAETFTAYDLIVLQSDPLVLGGDEKSWVVPHRVHDGLTPNLVELCACSGAMGLGPSFLGARVLASFEKNDLACAHLVRNRHGIVFQGDLTCDRDVRSFHELIEGDSFGAIAGFPCQPFSVQGARGGHDDPRAMVFWSVLRTSALLGAQFCILECVPPAATDQVIQAGLALFCRKMRWQCEQTILELAHQWVMHRRRWWAALMPAEWGHEEIPSWPMLRPQRCIQHILPSWGEWSERDERDLQLNRIEFLAYTNEEFGKGVRLLTQLDVGPTILHSYASAFSSSPCGCRAGGFSPLSLRQRGLRGVFILSEVTGQPRFLHPGELSLMLTIPLGMEWEPFPRQSLCLLGQCAAPLQALWLYAHVVKAARLKFQGLRHVNPETAIELYKNALVKQARETFPFSAFHGPCHLKLEMPNGEKLCVLRAGLSTVGHLLGAERINLGWGEKVVCMSNDTVLADDDLLHPGKEYVVVHKQKKQRKQMVYEMMTVAIQHRGQGFTALVEPGTFIFNALKEVGLEEVQFLVDEDGKVYGKDFKVWHSVFLYTLDASAFPSLCAQWSSRPLGVDAAFGSGNLDGLSVNAVWHAVKSMVTNVRGSAITKTLLVHPSYVHDLSVNDSTVNRKLLEHCRDLQVEEVIMPMLFQQHWALVVGVHFEGTWEWTYYDGWGTTLQEQAQQVVTKMMNILGGEDWWLTPQQEVEQMHDYTCGTVLLAHLMKFLELEGQFTPEVIHDMHHWMLKHQVPDGSPQGRGPDAKLVDGLSAVLCEKGVPRQLAHTRALEAISALGTQTVQQALNARNVWQALKTQANRPGIQFKFLKPHELQDYIAYKAQNGFGAEGKKKKVKDGKKGPPMKVEIDPSQLALHQGHFRDQEGAEIAQIALRDVVVNARGLALCTKQDALPFMEETDSMSTEALGLLVTSEFLAEEKGSADITSIRFAATYMATKEQVLISGSLVSLGDGKIKKHIQAGPGKPSEVTATQVIRLQVFRDEFAVDWSQFCEAPIKVIVNLVPQLQLCDGEGCGANCKRCHAPVETPCTQILLEVWARRFHSLEGRVTPASQADCFAAFLRIAHPAKEALVKVTIEGVYFEPRAESPPGPDREFAVVWLPQLSRQEVVHKLRTTPGTIALVRLKAKYGVRVASKDEEMVHTSCDPTSPS